MAKLNIATFFKVEKLRWTHHIKLDLNWFFHGLWYWILELMSFVSTLLVIWPLHSIYTSYRPKCPSIIVTPLEFLFIIMKTSLSNIVMIPQIVICQKQNFLKVRNVKASTQLFSKLVHFSKMCTSLVPWT